MRRTLIAKEKSAKPRAEIFTSVVDINFPLKSNIVKKLNERHEIVSKWPMVHQLSGINGTPFLGFRGSFGGFNHYFENLGSEKLASTDSEFANSKEVDILPGKSNNEHQSKHKRRSHVVHKCPSVKKPRKNRSL
nr:hypothetical transcript [Hymenolepis microstoma]